MTRRTSAPPRVGRRGVALGAIALSLAVGAAACPCALGQQMAPGTVLPAGYRNAFRMTQSQGGFQLLGPVSNAGALGYSKQTGLQIDWEANESGQFGYWPVAFTVSAANPAASDRQVRIEFTVGYWGQEGAAMKVEQSLTLKKNVLAARATLLVPRYMQWPVCGWKVWVDGQLDEEVSAENMNIPQQQVNVGVAALLATTTISPWEFQSTLQAVGNGSFTAQPAQPRDLPEDWTHYSTFDVVILPADELPALAAQFPRQRTALVRWLRAGGNLWLVNASKDWRELGEAERALGFRTGARRGGDESADESIDGAADDAATGEPEISAEADAAIVARGWKFVALGERALEPVDGALEISGYGIDEEPAPAQRPPGWRTGRGRPDAATTDGPAPTSQKWFAVRALGMGSVAAFRADLRDAQVPGAPVQVPGAWQPGMDPAMMGMDGRGAIPGTYEYGGQPMEAVTPEQSQMTEAQLTRYAVQRSLLAPRVNWTLRHGNKPDEANAEFNNWLIPGVGVAPVGQFQILISLFVLAIGPLNYWWLKRRKKLPMLLATVPAAAALVTLLLVTFGVLADGLGARVRARSFTLLDQTAGESASWTRLSYYAGISPRNGLELPRDTVIYPVMSTWAERRAWRGSAFRRTMEWDDEQRLTSGWLMSRTPTQYLAVAARPTRKRLELRATDEGLRIVNGLGVTVTHAVVQDHDGKLYWCENLAPDAGVVVPAVEADDVSGRLRRLFIDNYPEFPLGAEGITYGGGGFYGLMMSKNLMEAQLDAINSPILRSWENGGYIAVTDRGVDLDLGLDDAAEEGSFHVIRGKW